LSATVVQLKEVERYTFTYQYLNLSGNKLRKAKIISNCNQITDSLQITIPTEKEKEPREEEKQRQRTAGFSDGCLSQTSSASWFESLCWS